MLTDYTNYNYVLRKTKSFNKSRYSRNRQYYRTGVFLCLWANIILVLGSYYIFFRLTFKFSYLFIVMLSALMLVLFSYFSRNFTIGILRSALRLLNYISLNTLLFLTSLILKAKVLLTLHSTQLMSDIFINLWARLNTGRAPTKL